MVDPSLHGRVRQLAPEDRPDLMIDLRNSTDTDALVRLLAAASSLEALVRPSVAAWGGVVAVLVGPARVIDAPQLEPDAP